MAGTTAGAVAQTALTAASAVPSTMMAAFIEGEVPTATAESMVANAVGNVAGAGVTQVRVTLQRSLPSKQFLRLRSAVPRAGRYGGWCHDDRLRGNPNWFRIVSQVTATVVACDTRASDTSCE